MPDATMRESSTKPRGAYRGPGLTPHTTVYILRDRHGRSIGRLEIDADLSIERADSAAMAVLDMLDPTPAIRLVRS